MNEIWKDIKGYEGYYQVSNFGRVRSLDRKIWNYHFKCFRLIKGGIKKLVVDKYGYYGVCLNKENRQDRFTVHRLVATAFIPNPSNFPQVNHKNEIKTDNRVENLEWCSAKYNTNYGACIEKRIAPQRKKVAQYTLSGELVKIFPSFAHIERSLGFNHSALVSCCKKDNLTAYGYKWRYA